MMTSMFGPRLTRLQLWPNKWHKKFKKKNKNSANTPLGNSTTLLLGWKVGKDETTFTIDRKVYAMTS